MSIESALRDISNHQKDIAQLQREKSKEAERIAEAERKAANASADAAKSSNGSTKASKLREVQQQRENAARHHKQLASLESKTYVVQQKLNDAQKKYASETERAAKKELQERERANQEHARQIQEMSSVLTRHDRLHRSHVATMAKMKVPAEQISVLFLAANPRDQNELLLDEEVRMIGEMIRKSDHREAIKLESRWALRPGDLLQAMNEVAPRIVHFSGHGTGGGDLVFQNDAGESAFVPLEGIVAAMAATGDGIDLVFFNACDSRAQAEAVVRRVPAAIGMNDAIRDDAARIFSSQFYSALGFGHSVAKAFAQAKASLMLHGIPQESVPELFVGDGFDAEQLVLVRPSFS